MIRPFLLSLALAGAPLACGGSRPEPERTDDEDGMVSANPTDSLALRTPSGVEVWFSGSRPAQDSSGQVCVERTLQIRRDSSRVNIPLLYTGAPPTLVDDSTIEAAIWLHCRPGNVYRVSLRTGQPVRIR